jgi:hypothetical protein
MRFVETGAEYEGAFVDGMRDGIGKMVYGNLDEYTGMWSVGKRQGLGTLIKCGLTYKNCKWDNDTPSEGIVSYNNGDVYMGSLLDYKRHGNGRMNYAGEGRFYGNWASDIRSGKAEMIFNKNVVAHDETFGIDTEKDDCDHYDGDYADDRFNGSGKMRWVERGEEYDGNWVNGKCDGDGKMSYENGNVYEGRWENGQRLRGKMTYAKDDGVYIGEWNDNQRHGTGTMTYKDSSRYVGEWSGDKRHGTGTYYVGASTYYGEWRMDEMHGDSTIRGHIGDSTVATFNNGDYVSPLGDDGATTAKATRPTTVNDAAGDAQTNDGDALERLLAEALGISFDEDSDLD